MIITDSTYKKEYSKIVFGIMEENTTKTIDFYMYDDENGKDILIKGDNIAITNEWMEIRCVDAAIAWTKIDGITTFDLGSWDGYRKIEIKITVPANVEPELFDFTITSSSEKMTAQLAVNYTLDFSGIVNEALFGE